MSDQQHPDESFTAYAHRLGAEVRHKDMAVTMPAASVDYGGGIMHAAALFFFFLFLMCWL